MAKSGGEQADAARTRGEAARAEAGLSGALVETLPASVAVPEVVTIPEAVAVSEAVATSESVPVLGVGSPITTDQLILGIDDPSGPIDAEAFRELRCARLLLRSRPLLLPAELLLPTFARVAAVPAA